ncbi:acetylxylan esterase [Fimbriimonas ginsengisoli]|uniref:Acetyl xylan esterase n=1 Tax=Fimbriimonas ginsengisoli Gsoil 348 TaxID=661478 RepID=A0A068NV97_FIMGI|nr:acetylxylan esterase [Fimbriimonas ginsengisoli]AIE87297.1 acetyl xylan esterase [Fimbriimonas ginsengisoli Gsoil 348]
MPLVDMPLHELEHYQGRNPRPADFEEYWDTALAEMRAVDSNLELTPHPIAADFAECFDLWFTGVGGARIHAKFLRPKGKADCPAVLQFHGYTWHSGEWHDKLAYVANGICVASLDCRGQGGLSEDVGGVKGPTHKGHIIRGLDDAPEKLLFRSIFLDTAQLAKIVMEMPEVDANRVSAMGGSQGGALTIACAALEPRIRRAAPVYPFLSDYRRTWEMDQGGSAYEEIRHFFRMHDPRHTREEEIFTRLGYIDIQFLAPRVRAEVMMGVGLMDNICLPSTQFAAYNKLGGLKSTVVYPDYGHEGLPGFGDITYDFLARP